MSRFRYTTFTGGADPLAAPTDVRSAVDQIGNAVVSGMSLREAVRTFHRAGTNARRGLDDLAEMARKRRNQLRARENLGGTLDNVRRLLDQAVAIEREALDDPDTLDVDISNAMVSRMQLDSLPANTAAAVNELRTRKWRSDLARMKYEEIQTLLQREFMKAQFPGGTTHSAFSLDDTKDFLAELNHLLREHTLGHETDQLFEKFMSSYGHHFHNDPRTVDELIDELARQAAATQRMLRSMTPEQRDQVEALMKSMLNDLDLAAEMSSLQSALQQLRPGLTWGADTDDMTGEPGLSFGAGTALMADLGELEQLEQSLRMGHPGASLDDVDVQALTRQLGQSAADDFIALRDIDKQLKEQGWLNGAADELELSPRTLRRMGATALSAIFRRISGGPLGDHNSSSRGQAGESTGMWRRWQFGDEQPLHAAQTVQNAVLRSVAEGSSGVVRLVVEDFAVEETDATMGAAVALCIDLSWSMYAQDRWGDMKQTALALHHLINTKFPYDELQIIGFGLEAQRMTELDLAMCEPAGVPGTNLQGALQYAAAHFTRHRGLKPVLLVITDGEPTAHYEAPNKPFFWWPTTSETIKHTVREVDTMTRRGIELNVFVLGDDPGLHRFMSAIVRRNGGRMFTPDPSQLGSFVVEDFVTSRRR